jgi:hypothetical protein
MRITVMRLTHLGHACLLVETEGVVRPLPRADAVAP